MINNIKLGKCFEDGSIIDVLNFLSESKPQKFDVNKINKMKEKVIISLREELFESIKNNTVTE